MAEASLDDSDMENLLSCGHYDSRSRGFLFIDYRRFHHHVRDSLGKRDPQSIREILIEANRLGILDIARLSPFTNITYESYAEYREKGERFGSTIPLSWKAGILR